jgi:hypothetical protein
MSVIVVTGGFASGGFGAVLTGYAALLAVMVATGAILSLTVLAEGWMNEKITNAGGLICSAHKAW